MATTEIIRRITIQGRSEGLDQLAADVRRVGQAQGELAQVTDSTSRRQLSAQQAVDRLRASHDAGFRAMERFRREVAVLNRGMDQSIPANYARELRNIQSALQNAPSRGPVLPSLDPNQLTGAALSGGSARASAAVFEEQERAVTALRAAIDPLGTATDRLNGQLAEYQALAAAGAISTTELAAAQALAQRNFDLFARTQDGAAAATRLSAFEITNLGMQLNDIAVMTASGQNPGVMLMQQGMQIAQGFQAGSLATAGLKAQLMGLGTGILTFMTSPINMAVMAVAGLAAGVAYLWNTWESGPDIEDALETHKDIISQIVEGYGAAGRAVEAYGKVADNVLRARLQNQEEAILANIQSGAGSVLTENFAAGFDPLGVVSDWLIATQGILDFSAAGEKAEGALRRLQDELRRGVPDINDFEQAIVAALADPSIDREQRKILRNILDQTAALAEQQRQLEALTRLDQIQIVEQTTGMAGGRTVQRTKSDAEPSPGTKALENALTTAAAEERARRSLEYARPAIGSKDPTDRMRAENSAKYFETEAEAIEAANDVTLTYLEHQQELADAVSQRTRSYEDSIAAAQMDLQVMDRSVGEAERLRIQYDLTTAAKNAAADAGTIVSAEELALINQTAAALGNLAQQTALMELSRDVGFERDQMFRGQTDQRVASEMRGIYGDDYVGQMDSAIARQIRFNEQLSTARDLSADFAKGFASDLQSGVGALEALGNALDRLASRLLDMALDQAINGLFQNLLGVVGGGGLSRDARDGIRGVTAGLFHQGGMVGEGGTSRFVHPAYFDGAIRMHAGGIAGLRANEIPAILERGERVQSRAEVAAGAGTSSFVYAPVYNVDARSDRAEVLAMMRAEGERTRREIPALVANARGRGRL